MMKKLMEYIGDLTKAGDARHANSAYTVVADLDKLPKELVEPLLALGTLRALQSHGVSSDADKASGFPNGKGACATEAQVAAWLSAVKEAMPPGITVTASVDAKSTEARQATAKAVEAGKSEAVALAKAAARAGLLVAMAGQPLPVVVAALAGAGCDPLTPQEMESWGT
jgi:hypothetical protein